MKIESSKSTATTGKCLAMSKPVSSYLSQPLHPFPVVVLQMHVYLIHNNKVKASVKFYIRNIGNLKNELSVLVWGFHQSKHSR